ncbi:MAG: CpXC domain-containing protein [Alphaproteobacteria bacterium]|nr:CpXC domain-containing protein [Alphaproteobacteria bacterium]
MSIFKPTVVSCPSCLELTLFEANQSVNADRRPDLRDAILDNSFQQGTCTSCGHSFRLDPDFTYFDQALGLWIYAKPLAALGDWPTHEAKTAEVFMLTYGILAPPVVQAIGEALEPRVTFGWAALREKIVAKQHGIDDATLEVAKVGVMKASGRSVWDDEVELRLSSVDDDELGFVWLKGPTEQLDGLSILPRQYLADVEADPETFAALREKIVGPHFVDLNRALVVEDEEEEEAAAGA